jgi:hypothetical protein
MDDTSVKEWYKTLKAPSPPKMIQVKAPNRQNSKYRYCTEDNDKYVCIYILNDRIHSLAKTSQQTCDLLGKHADNILEKLASGEKSLKKEIWDAYFLDLFGDEGRSRGHNSVFYTMIPDK